MQKRHENSLTDLLEGIAFEGFANIPKWQVTRWYGQTNFTVNIRRDLRERWKSLTEDMEWGLTPTLRIAEVNGNIVLMRETDFFPDNE